MQIDGFQQIDLGSDIFRQIFKHSTIPTIVHDLEMNIIDANDIALEEFGFNRFELLRKSILDLHTEDELEHSNEVLTKMNKENKVSIETKFIRKDGSVFIAEATPCKYMIGQKAVIHVFIHDITERKEEKKRLQQLNDYLEKKIAEADQYAREIELKNKELQEFAYVAAHDLKAPLTNISTLASMINPEAITEKDSRDFFERLKKSIGKLHKIVFTLNDVLSFKTTLKDRKERLQFEAVYNDIEESIAEQLEASKAEIHKDFSECPEVDYPPLHLKSVIQNLLTNALKYRDPEKVLKVDIKTSIRNGSVCLEVKDNGIGFDAEKYSRKVLGLFRRLHTHVEGKGIGMYIVKSILDTHGGRIEVKSKPGEGATFYIYLN